MSHAASDEFLTPCSSPDAPYGLGDSGFDTQPRQRNPKATRHIPQGGGGRTDSQNVPHHVPEVTYYGRSWGGPPAQGESEHGVAEDQEGVEVLALCYWWWCGGKGVTATGIAQHCNSVGSSAQRVCETDAWFSEN
jgi:hypothetical protein